MWTMSDKQTQDLPTSYDSYSPVHYLHTQSLNEEREREGGE